MKKIIATFFALFIILTMALPVFAVECEEHIVNFPATPAYTHEAGIDIYLCDDCGKEMWHCNECDIYMSIEQVHCENCYNARAARNSQEQAEINREIQEQQDFNKLFIMLIVFFGLLMLAVIVAVYKSKDYPMK